MELLLSATTDDGAEIGEWSWRGTHTDGSTFDMRGVIVMGIEASKSHGRLYMELIEREGGDIDQMVREAYRPPGSE